MPIDKSFEVDLTEVTTTNNIWDRNITDRELDPRVALSPVSDGEPCDSICFTLTADTDGEKAEVIIDTAALEDAIDACRERAEREEDRRRDAEADAVTPPWPAVFDIPRMAYAGETLFSGLCPVTVNMLSFDEAPEPLYRIECCSRLIPSAKWGKSYAAGLNWTGTKEEAYAKLGRMLEAPAMNALTYEWRVVRADA